MSQHKSLLPSRISKPGPILDYLQTLIASGDEGATTAKRATLAVKRVLETEDGAILMDLLEKSTVDYFLPQSAEPSALDELNSQRFLVLDLRRMKTDETHKILAQRTELETRGRTRRR